MSNNMRDVKIYMIYGNYIGVNLELFQQYILDSKDIIAYWNHIPLLYGVKTKLDIGALAPKIKPFFGENHFLIAEVSPGMMNGWLPKAAWDWFYAPVPDQRNDVLAALLSHGAGGSQPKK